MKSLTSLTRIAAGIALVVLSSSPSFAVAFTGLWNTGVDSAGNPNATGVADSHYTLTESPNLTGYTFETIDRPAAWTATASDARWIGPAHPMDNQLTQESYFGLASDPVGLYKYVLTFTLNAFSDAWLSGSWASDNRSWIYLNGTEIASRDIEKPFESPLANFLVNDSSLFNIGLNVLEFWVNNDSQIVNGQESIWGNPTGLLVSGLQGEYTAAPDTDTSAQKTAVPDGGTSALLLSLGILGLVGVKRFTALA